MKNLLKLRLEIVDFDRTLKLAFYFICGFNLIVVNSLQLHAQDNPKVKSESWYLDGQNIKYIEFDSLGRLSVKFEREVTKLPFRTDDRLEWHTYPENSNTLEIEKSLFGKLQDDGTIVFAIRKKVDGWIGIHRRDSLNRTYGQIIKFNIEGDPSKILLSDALAKSLNFFQPSTLYCRNYELIDSTNIQTIWKFNDHNSYGTLIRKFDTVSNHLVYSENHYNYLNGGESYYCKFITDTSSFDTGCSYKVRDKDYCYSSFHEMKRKKKTKSTYYKDFGLSDGPRKIDYIIDYEYPHPTLERRIITKGKKKFLIEIRKQFY